MSRGSKAEAMAISFLDRFSKYRYLIQSNSILFLFNRFLCCFVGPKTGPGPTGLISCQRFAVSIILPGGPVFHIPFSLIQLFPEQIFLTLLHPSNGL